MKNICFDHYYNSFLSYLKLKNEVLTNDQLEKYAAFIVKSSLKRLDNDSKIARRLSLIIYQEKNKCENNEKLLLRFSKLISVDKNIIDYFTNKYIFILDEKINYKVLKNKFEEIVFNVLANRDNNSYDMNYLIEKELKEYIYNNYRKKNNSNELKKLTIKEIEDVKSYYSYLKILIGNKYIDDIPYQVLKNKLDIEYNRIFNEYLHKNMDMSINKYVLIRLTSIMENSKNKYYNIKNNYKIIYEYILDEVFETLNNEYKEMLMSECDNFIMKYLESESKNFFVEAKIYIINRLIELNYYQNAENNEKILIIKKGEKYD